MSSVVRRAWAEARRIAGAGLAHVVAAAGVAGASFAPRLASACAVCTSGRDDESNTAFLISTIFLSLLPLAALGTLVFVLWRRIRRLESESADGAGLPLSSASISSSATSSIAPPITPNPAH
ncbi:hypothetical protein K2X89_00290 [Myxococcota bacterium]|nr:hypothetical protein [Myxococcota bacterium]